MGQALLFSSSSLNANMETKHMTIEEFCHWHAAPDDLKEWLFANYSSMQDAWEKLRPDWLIWVATREGVLTDKELRLFAVWSARHVQHLMTDKRSIDALDVSENYAHGKATSEEMASAWAKANAAAGSVASSAADNFAWHAAMAAAWASSSHVGVYGAWHAASCATWAYRKAAASSAASSAEWSAAMDAGMTEARSYQSAWLRVNTAPNFNPPSE